MSLRLGGDGAITGCSSLSEPALTLSGLTVNNDSGNTGATITAAGNAFLVLDSSVGGTAGNQISFIDFKNNGTNQANLAVNEGVTGKPLEINSSTSNNVSLVTGGGKVGIGTASPLSPLHIFGDSNTTNTGATLLIDDSATAGADVGGTVGFRGSDGSTQRTYGLIKGGKETSGAAFDGYLSFQTRANGQSNTTEHVRIKSNGDVGIGTSSPGAKLEIACPADTTTGITEAQIQLKNTGNQVFNFAIWDTDDFSISSGSGNARRFTIAQTGHVGINNTAPSFKLDVDSQIRAGATSGYGFLALGSHPSEAYRNWHIASEGNGFLSFFNGNDGSGSKRVTIGSNGNFGVGTSSPQAALDIGNEGDLFLSSSDNTVEEKNEISWRIEDGSEGAFISAFRTAVSNAPHDLLFGTRSSGGSISERMRITNSGNLGLGSSNPVQKLHVQGTSNDTIDETTGTLRLQASGGNGLLFGTRASGPFNSYIQSAFVADTSIARYGLSLNPIGGNVGVNKIDPGYPMDIEGNLRVSSGVSGLGLIQLGSDSNAFDNFHLGSDSGGSFRIWNKNIGTGITMLQLDSNGNLTLPVTLNGSGNRAVYSNSSGTLTNSASDARMKKNVNTLESQVETIKQLNPVTYNWLEETGLGDQQEIGFIAQEIEPLVPQVIGINSDDTLSLDYPKLTAVLTKGLQEALAKIENLESEVAALKASA